LEFFYPLCFSLSSDHAGFCRGALSKKTAALCAHGSPVGPSGKSSRCSALEDRRSTPIQSLIHSEISYLFHGEIIRMGLPPPKLQLSISWSAAGIGVAHCLRRLSSVSVTSRLKLRPQYFPCAVFGVRFMSLQVVLPTGSKSPGHSQRPNLNGAGDLSSSWFFRRYAVGLL